MSTTGLHRSRSDAVRARAGAFTSIELLVVIVVLALLAVIALPALARVGEKDIRVVCLNNEKQLYAGLQMYCDDNGDKLPTLASAGYWAWDLPASATTAMLNSGCTKKTFYCPSTAPRFTDDLNWAGAHSLWNYSAGSGVNIVGYTFAISGGQLDGQFQNLKIVSEPHTKTGSGNPVFMDTPATRELIADVVISWLNSLPASPSNDFDDIPGGFGEHHLSAHIKKGIPAGGNIAYKDGHVAWKKFDATHGSAPANPSQSRTGSERPYFWW